MKALADALVYAVVYIDSRPEDGNVDDDVGALESIAGCLSNTTAEEQDALAAAAERELAAVKSRFRPPEEIVNAYALWMENMFGDDRWKGNKRI